MAPLITQSKDQSPYNGLYGLYVLNDVALHICHPLSRACASSHSRRPGRVVCCKTTPAFGSCALPAPSAWDILSHIFS